MTMTSNKPYLIRAIYDWIVDNQLTPYILVNAEYPEVEVPQEYVNGGRIILNISPESCRGLHLENDRIVFTTRFSGQTMQISMSPGAVLAIYAKENGRGMEFGEDYDPPPPAAEKDASPGSRKRGKPDLKLVE
jgi:stringent starvation protein B